MYTFSGNCFDEYFSFHIISGRYYFLYKFSVTKFVFYRHIVAFFEASIWQEINFKPFFSTMKLETWYERSIIKLGCIAIVRFSVQTSFFHNIFCILLFGECSTSFFIGDIRKSQNLFASMFSVFCMFYFWFYK